MATRKNGGGGPRGQAARRLLCSGWVFRGRSYGGGEPFQTHFLLGAVPVMTRLSERSRVR